MTNAVELPVRVLLRAEGDDPDSMRSLRQWLQNEPAVRAHGDLRWGETSSQSRMGAGIEVLSLALSSLLSAGQLAIMVAQWRGSRHPAPVVTVTRELDDGTTVRIETSDPEALAWAVRELEAT